MSQINTLSNSSTAQNETSQEETKIVKCKPGQGKLNRLIIKAQLKLAQLGYPENKRFKRDYETCTAVWTCPQTGKTCFVNGLNKEISGNALSQTFVEAMQGTNNG